MSQETTRPISAEEANRMLPLVSAIVKDLAILSLEVSERRQRISQISGGRENESDLYSEEVAAIVKELEENVQELERFETELDQLGVTCKNQVEGIVTFPSELDGRPIYLSWKLGEPEVIHWYDIDGGFDDRQQLPALADS